MSDFEYVYVIVHEHGYVKIGKAKDPYSRFCSIKTGSPYKLRLWLAARCSKYVSLYDYEHLEKYLHDEFEEYNIRGEWFDVEPVEVFQTMARAVESEDKPGMWICNAEERIEQYQSIGKRVSQVF